jgi:hypothetical protein
VDICAGGSSCGWVSRIKHEEYVRWSLGWW